MRFTKYHALGNDYLVLDPKDAADLPSTEDIVRICHRNFGLGSDGILYGPLNTDKARFGLRILNPDGSEAEKSGNGLRIFARYLRDVGQVKEGAFTVDTPGGVVTCKVDDPKDAIEVEMGAVHFGMDHIPVDGPEQTDHNLGQKLEVNGTEYTVYIADIGNPHCVVPLREISKEIACRDGAAIEVHENFPSAPTSSSSKPSTGTTSVSKSGNAAPAIPSPPAPAPAPPPPSPTASASATATSPCTCRAASSGFISATTTPSA